MIEQHDHWHDFVEWLLRYWVFISFAVIATSGMVWWALHKVFATHDKMMLCKQDLYAALKMHEEHEDTKTKELKEQLLRYQQEYQITNEAQHARISDKIDHLTDVVIENIRRLS